MKHDDQQQQAERDFRAAVAAWKATAVPKIKQLWSGWTVGQRAAFAQRVDKDAIFDHDIAQDDGSTINCYRGQGQAPCDAIGVTYTAPTAEDEAAVRKATPFLLPKSADNPDGKPVPPKRKP